MKTDLIRAFVLLLAIIAILVMSTSHVANALDGSITDAIAGTLPDNRGPYVDRIYPQQYPDHGPGRVCIDGPTGHSGGCAAGAKGPFYSDLGIYITTARAADSLSNIAVILTDSKSYLSKINSQAEAIAKQTKETQDTLKNMVEIFNKDLRKSISERFDNLPQELVASPAITKLKEDILKEVDKKIAENK